MIRSILDTDFYKLTMQQVVFHKFTHLNAKYKMVFRNAKQGQMMREHIDELTELIWKLQDLVLTREERTYLESLGLFKEDYLDFLSDFRFRPTMSVSEGNELVMYFEGPWLQTILFEVPVLAIACELMSRKLKGNEYDEYSNILIGALERDFMIPLNKAKTRGNINFAEFGTRRRYGYEHHKKVLDYITKTCKKVRKGINFVGTSNVHFAMTYGLKPIGTMAHEYLQAMQHMVPLWDSQKHALQVWSEEYRGNLGIALTDVISMDAFLNDFDLYFAKLFDGLRHDSGDPIIWGNKALDHYEKLGIDPKTKTLVFSDGLDASSILGIQRSFAGVTNLSYGVGTNLTHGNGTYAEKPNVVLKLVEINGRPVAKISDEPGKSICEDATYLRYLKHVFKN